MLHHQLHLHVGVVVVGGGELQRRIEDLDLARELDVTRSQDPFTALAGVESVGPLPVQPQADLLDVEDQGHRILAEVRDGSEVVLDPVQLYRGHGGPWK